MGRFSQRILLAFLLSSTGLLITEYWYQLTEPKSTRTGETSPIARLKELSNDVQKKPSGRTFWQSALKDESFFTGETVRTASDSEAKLLFLKSGAIVHLDPDSVIELQETESGIALDFLKGNLHIQNVSSTEDLTLKAGNQKIDVKDADLTLSSQKSGAVAVEVHRGVAQVIQNGSLVKLNQNKSNFIDKNGRLNESDQLIRVTSPLPGSPLFLDDREVDGVTFQWQKLPAGFMVFLETGRSREQLARVVSRSAPGESGEIKVRFKKTGKFFWRLVAVPKVPGREEMQSLIHRTELLAKLPPTLLTPEKNAVVLANEKTPVKLSWVQKTLLDQVVLELSKSPDLTQPIMSGEVKGVSFYDFVPSESGAYYWRVSGFIQKNVPVSSPIHMFRVQKEVTLSSPSLKSPLANQSLSFTQVQEKGVNFTWESATGVGRYKIQVFQGDQELVNEVVLGATYNSKNLPSGNLTWRVTSVDDKGRESSPSDPITFTIEAQPVIEFALGPEPENVLYFTERPSFSVAWKKPHVEVKNYKLRYAKAGKITEETPWTDVTSTEFSQFLDSDGDYELEVVSVSPNDQVTAKSPRKTLRVSRKPLLPGPDFGHKTPPRIVSNKNGSLEVDWVNTPRAKRYKVEIVDPSGKVASEQWADRSPASLQKLKPGEYKVQVRAVDEHNRLGPPGESKAVEVPNVSNIQAPKLKLIDVK